MSWGSDNLICYMPEYYTHASTDLTYQVSDKDHLLDKSMLQAAGIDLESHTSFQGPKGRHYIIGRVTSK